MKHGYFSSRDAAELGLVLLVPDTQHAAGNDADASGQPGQNLVTPGGRGRGECERLSRAAGSRCN